MCNLYSIYTQLTNRGPYNTTRRAAGWKPVAYINIQLAHFSTMKMEAEMYSKIFVPIYLPNYTASHDRRQFSLIKYKWKVDARKCVNHLQPKADSVWRSSDFTGKDLAFQTEEVTTGLSLCHAPRDSLRLHSARPQTSNRLIISTWETNSPPNYAPHQAHKAVRPTLGYSMNTYS
jgi:hypothetical protein